MYIRSNVKQKIIMATLNFLYTEQTGEFRNLTIEDVIMTKHRTLGSAQAQVNRYCNTPVIIPQNQTDVTDYANTIEEVCEALRASGHEANYFDLDIS